MSVTRKRNPKQGEKFRLIVKSAEEAVIAIREQYGENARVISVEQVGGKGLARFLSAPQLEVIGMVVSAEEIEREKASRARETDARREQQPQTQLPSPVAPQANPLPQPPPQQSPAQPTAARQPVATAPAPAQQPDGRPERPARPGRPTPVRPQPAAGRPERPARPGTRPAVTPPPPAPSPSALSVSPVPPAQQPQPVAIQPPPQPVQPPQPANDVRMREVNTPLTPSGKETLESLLNKARFDSDLIQRITNNSDWERISQMQLNHGLSEVYNWLRTEYQKLDTKPIAMRMAFMGTPGCGKTTSLCKRMANDVFVHGKQIQVLKVEGESPNPDDALRVLCDILGVELFRDPFDLDRVNPNGDLYVDVPGVSLNEREQWKTLGKRLDDLYVETRVLVINAAYEKEAIKEMLNLGSSIGCTHQVFTHLDELANITKLWQFILGSQLTTLFFSYGQNVTSEFSNNILEFMTSKTFPSYLTN